MESEDPEKCLWRMLWLEEEHHCCQFTEVKEALAPAGVQYLEGDLWFSKDLRSRQLDFKITLVSTDSLRTYKNLSDGNIANLRIHPNLLYILRYDETKSSCDQTPPKRLYDQESRIPLWRVELKILDGKVDWWTESEAQPGGYYQHVYQMDTDEDGNWVLPMHMLRLVVVTPLQRTNATGIKIREALQLRRAMYEEIDEDRWDKLVRELDRFYKKDGKPELERFCLQFDVTIDPGSLLQTRLPTIMSDPILNSKNKTCSYFDLTGSISHEKSCTQFQRVTHLFFKNQLPVTSAQMTALGHQPDVTVRFVIRHKQGQEYLVDRRINQPAELRVEPLWIEFDIPVQQDHIIRDIYKGNNDIYLEGFRPKDKFRTKTKVKFHYQTHHENSFCIFCSSNPDKIGLDLLSDSLSPIPSLSSIPASLSPVPARKRSKLTNGDVVYTNGEDNDSLDVSEGSAWDEVDSITSRKQSRTNTPPPLRYSLGSLVMPEDDSPKLPIKSQVRANVSLSSTDISLDRKSSQLITNRNGTAANNTSEKNGVKNNEKMNGNGNQCTTPVDPDEPFLISPRKIPSSPSYSSFCTFILFPSSVVLCLLFLQKDFPSFSEMLQMSQFVMYLVGVPAMYQALYNQCNLTQTASTVLAFGLCFIFMQIFCSYIF